MHWAPCNSYIRWLPMVFKPQLDKKLWYSKLMFAQHFTNLAPFWDAPQEPATLASLFLTLKVVRQKHLTRSVDLTVR